MTLNCVYCNSCKLGFSGQEPHVIIFVVQHLPPRKNARKRHPLQAVFREHFTTNHDLGERIQENHNI